MWSSAVALLGLAVLTYFIYKKFFTSSQKYWEQFGVSHLDASSAASMWQIILSKKDLSHRDTYAYDYMSRTGEPFCGLEEFSFKTLVVKDLDMVKKILIKDFDYFADRRDFLDWAKDDSIFKKMMSAMNGEGWRNLRHTVSPTFTTGKIRRMMDCFNSVGKEWVSALTEKAKGESLEIDVQSCVNQYTVDVIAAAVFAMNAGTIRNQKSHFALMALRFVNINSYKMALGLQFPKLIKFLGIEVFDMEATCWFEKILNQGLQERLKDNGAVRKNDFLQLLVDARKGELKNAGEDELVNDFEKEAQQQSGKEIFLTDDYMNAQSLLFFIAGFGTTTNFISFALYALAAHPDLQERLREEVSAIVKENGDLDYDDVGKLAFMDMFVCEVLRSYPAALRLERRCNKEYKDAETGLTVPKGTLVIIPVYSIHRDPEYYPDPEKFDPEGHFSPQKKAKRSPYAFLSFGSGPRNCIGMRFALIESKAAVAHIVHNFLIAPAKTTPIPMEAQCLSFQLMPPKGLKLELTPIAK